jgi:hypothetical protein
MRQMGKGRSTTTNAIHHRCVVAQLRLTMMILSEVSRAATAQHVGRRVTESWG